MTISDKADLFHTLHGGGRVLVLPNAWDAASARIIEHAGATAIATTSAGVAWSLGVPDGDRLGREQAVELIARVVAAVDVPVTADVETGFGADADGVAETIRDVLAAGAVGVNLEDALHTGAGGLRDVQEQADRFAAARGAADAAGVPLFVNARVDTFLLSVGKPEGRLAESVRRAKAYVAAGADGVFVPGVMDPATITALVEQVPAPLNVLASPGAPTIAELGELGVARVSVGGRIALAAYSLTARAAAELLDDGTYESARSTLTHGDLNALLDR